MLPAVFIGISGIAYQILRVQDDDSSKTERAVLMLSDPAIHLTVFWGIQWVSEFVKTEYYKAEQHKNRSAFSVYNMQKKNRFGNQSGWHAKRDSNPRPSGS